MPSSHRTFADLMQAHARIAFCFFSLLLWNILNNPWNATQRRATQNGSPRLKYPESMAKHVVVVAVCFMHTFFWYDTTWTNLKLISKPKCTKLPVLNIWKLYSCFGFMILNIGIDLKFMIAFQLPVFLF